MAKEKDDLTTDDKFMLLLEALTARKEEGISKETLAELLSKNATAMQKALKPENDAHPNISALHPKGGDFFKMPHEFSYNNFPVSKFPETHHDRELELAAQVQPGEYTVLRKDGSLMTVNVVGEYDAKQKLTKVAVRFPLSREEKWLVPPMMVVLYQLVYPDHPRRRFMEAMNEFMLQTLGDEAVPA